VKNNEIPEEAHALYIMFKGREWIIMHSSSGFHAIAADEYKVQKKEVNALFGYLVAEGFINNPQSPPQHQTT
jgi:hypothetical protein